VTAPGPREELLATGELGPAGVKLLYTSVRQAVRLRRLPPPPGAPVWTADALMEAAHDIVASRQGPARFAILAARSSDEASFRSQLFTLVMNDLASANRRSARGRLSERVKDVVADMPDVHVVNGKVILGAASDAPTASFADFVAAAAQVLVTVPQWDDQARRQAPVADAASVQALVRSVLALAPRGLPHRDLVAVLAHRLGVHDAPQPVDQDALEMLAPSALDDPAQVAVDSVRGRQLLDQLMVEQQMVLPYLEESVRDIAELTGLRRSKAWQVAQSTRLRLADLLADEPDAVQVLGAATDLARTRWGLG